MSPLAGIQIIAHRGYSARAPENTLAALDAALEAGVDAVEFDLRTAACGTPVLFHDPMLGRTTNGVGPLGRRPVGHLKALDAGEWFGAAFKDERIPTQEEALQHVAGRVHRVFQDIKGYREMEDLDRMVEITRKTNMAGATVFVSSDWVVMNRLRLVAPEIQRAYLVEEAAAFPEALDRAVVDEGSLMSLEVGFALGNPGGVQEAIENEVDLVSWTVNDRESATQLVNLGIHGITTDEVTELLSWRDSRR
jgi:glycerophosphoryl diester phosphodiesterase